MNIIETRDVKALGLSNMPYDQAAEVYETQLENIFFRLRSLFEWDMGRESAEEFETTLRQTNKLMIISSRREGKTFEDVLLGILDAYDLISSEIIQIALATQTNAWKLYEKTIYLFRWIEDHESADLLNDIRPVIEDCMKINPEVQIKANFNLYFNVSNKFLENEGY